MSHFLSPPSKRRRPTHPPHLHHTDNTCYGHANHPRPNLMLPNHATCARLGFIRNSACTRSPNESISMGTHGNFRIQMIASDHHNLNRPTRVTSVVLKGHVDKPVMTDTTAAPILPRLQHFTLQAYSVLLACADLAKLSLKTTWARTDKITF